MLSLAAVGASAQAAIGGIGGGGVSPAGQAVHLGSRVLHVGMEGSDVGVLNAIVRSKPYGRRIALSQVFESPTAVAVARFQARARLEPTGVVDRRTAKALTASMRRARATWYGPGFYGRRTACGRVLRPGTIGVAHRRLPCGARVTFAYYGRYLVAPVIDRGPFARGVKWDLTNGAREALGLQATDRLRYAVADRRRR